MGDHRRTPQDVRDLVQSCFGVYRTSDVARYFGMNSMTVRRIWGNERERETRDLPEPPNIWGCRPTRDHIDSDIYALMVDTRMTVKAAADRLGVEPSRVRAALDRIRLKAGEHEEDECRPDLPDRGDGGPLDRDRRGAAAATHRVSQ